MAIHFILQNMVIKILMKLKCFACKIERKFFHTMCIFLGEISISGYCLISRVQWDLEKELAMKKSQQNKTKTQPYSDLTYC